MNKQVALVMGSISDWKHVKVTAQLLDELNVSYSKHIISAHRMPEQMINFGKKAKSEHYQVIIAAAGGAAHLPGMLAANTTLPVIGIPIQTKALNGMDSLFSINQMPSGVPVATVAIGNGGLKNAALLAGQILSLQDENVYQNLVDFRKQQSKEAIQSNDQL